MTTINISIPEKLKAKAEELIRAGYYASFSDMVRDALRRTIETNTYDLMAEKAEKEYAEGRGIVLRSQQDIDDYFAKLKIDA